MALLSRGDFWRLLMHVPRKKRAGAHCALR